MTQASWSYRAGASLAVVTALLICWMNLTVGIAGAEDNPVNLSFFGLAAVAAVGSFAAEFRAKGMARTMTCNAAIQLMLGLIVATGPVAADEPAGPTGLFALNAVFALLWFASGAFLAKAAQSEVASGY